MDRPSSYSVAPGDASRSRILSWGALAGVVVLAFAYLSVGAYLAIVGGVRRLSDAAARIAAISFSSSFTPDASDTPPRRWDAPTP